MQVRTKPGEHNAGQIVDRFLGTQDITERQRSQEPRMQLPNIRFAHADGSRADLLVISDNQQLFCSKQNRQSL